MKKIKNIILKNKKITIIVIGVAFILSNLIIANNTRKDGKRYVFWSDAGYYYSYLPQFFIHKNLFTQNEKKQPITKYTNGVALLQIPFFLIALLVDSFNNPKPDGLNHIFEFCITLSTLTYCFFGLLLMYFVLRRYVPPLSAIISLILIYFATNIEYYCVGESGFSHAYSFFTMSLFIYSVYKFFDNNMFKYSLLMGLSYGLSVLIRPTNFLIIFLIFFINLNNNKEIIIRTKSFFKENFKQTIIFLIFFILGLLPQLIYWYYSTGSFIYYSYQGETFTRLHDPKIFKILFGSASGLFVYSAILLSIFPGAVLLWKMGKKLFVKGIFLIFLLITYLNGSWWTPTFDCSFGHRAFIEFYPLALIPMAIFINWTNKTKLRFVLFSTLFCLLIFINVRFTYLYKKYPCWISSKEENVTWGWDNVAYVLRVTFFIDPQPSYHFKFIEKKDKDK